MLNLKLDKLSINRLEKIQPIPINRAYYPPPFPGAD
jgi:hypothetical protein